jgi:hypothetical protein
MILPKNSSPNFPPHFPALSPFLPPLPKPPQTFLFPSCPANSFLSAPLPTNLPSPRPIQALSLSSAVPHGLSSSKLAQKQTPFPSTASSQQTFLPAQSQPPLPNEAGHPPIPFPTPLPSSRLPHPLPTNPPHPKKFPSWIKLPPAIPLGNTNFLQNCQISS